MILKKVTAYRYNVTILLGILGLLLAIFSSAYLSYKYRSQPTYTHTKQVLYSFTLQNTTGRLMKGAELWMRAPMKETAIQLPKSIEVSQAHQLITSER
jgi:hypothetical protein